jgi:hypothetical protein
MLLWIKGNPGPQSLRDRLADENGFRLKMFTWIESIVKCELPGMTEILEEGREPLPRPSLSKGATDPRLQKQPQISEMSEDEFSVRFREFVEELAIRCNWHVHNETCWKHLKPGETKGDPVCRMRIDGKTRTFTDLDNETQSIMLKRLHPRINNYNEVIMFLMQCNMDIKYIGSGPAAKALVYYVTDYITKENLSTHVGLEALAYAIRQNDKKFEGDIGTPSSEKTKSLFVKTVNAMMARQENSHQQVMSHLIGGGDHYKANTFKLLKWAEIDRHIKSQLYENTQEKNCKIQDILHGDDNTQNIMVDTQSVENAAGQEFLNYQVEGNENGDAGEMTLHVEDESIVPANPVLDYCKCSKDEAFDKLCL